MATGLMRFLAVAVLSTAGLTGVAAAEVINGTDRPDILHGTPQADEMHGYEGPDQLYGRRGNDRLHGGKGSDQLFGRRGADDLFPGKDRFVKDFLYGGPGEDYIRARLFDRVRAGDGDDQIRILVPTGSPWYTVRLDCGAGDDTVTLPRVSEEPPSSCEHVNYVD